MDKIAFLIKQIIKDKVTNISRLNSGIISESYSFDTLTNKYVVRFDDKRINFDKDLYAFKNFNNYKLPIPEIKKIGKINNRFYAISVRAKGKILREYDSKIKIKLLPQVLEILYNIAITKIPAGFGYWNSSGQADYKNWTDFILDVRNSLSDKILGEKLIKNIKSNIDICPNDRSLIHGDFGFNNILSDGEKITAVIDWGDSKYGDFVYDIAWLVFWSSNTDYVSLFKKFYSKKGIDIPYFDKRINCYFNHIAMEVLSFYDKQKDKEGYKLAYNKLVKSLEKL